MNWYESEVRELESALKQERLPEKPAAFYGSSSIRMWPHLAKDLRDCRAVNVGFGGSTLAACVHFFPRLVPPIQPGSVVVYAGDNDLGDGQSPRTYCGRFTPLPNWWTRFWERFHSGLFPSS